MGLGTIKTAPANYVSRDIIRDGIDGSIALDGYFSPYQLEITFVMQGSDIYDYHLFEREIREFLNVKKMYYVFHDKMPGIRFPVNGCSVSLERKYKKNAVVTITWNVYKGFSESLGTTLDMFTYDTEKWQIGQNLPNGEDLQYVFQRNSFSVYNASSFEVNPLMGHQFDIALTCDGMPTIRNVTNGSSISLKKQVAKSNIFLVNGVYPYLDNQRCGRDTNHGIVKLGPGWNKFEITGATNINVAFNFRYMYR